MSDSEQKVEDQSPEESSSTSSPTQDPKAYWNSSLKIVGVILAIWAFVFLGCSILFREALDGIAIGGAGLGFWMSQQGSIICFVLLLILYAFLMNKLDKKHGYDEENKK